MTTQPALSRSSARPGLQAFRETWRTRSHLGSQGAIASAECSRQAGISSAATCRQARTISIWSERISAFFFALRSILSPTRSSAAQGNFRNETIAWVLSPRRLRETLRGDIGIQRRGCFGSAAESGLDDRGSAVRWSAITGCYESRGSPGRRDTSRRPASSLRVG